MFPPFLPTTDPDLHFLSLFRLDRFACCLNFLTPLFPRYELPSLSFPYDDASCMVLCTQLAFAKGLLRSRRVAGSNVSAFGSTDACNTNPVTTFPFTRTTTVSRVLVYSFQQRTAIVSCVARTT